MEASNSSIIQPFDPFGRMVDSVAQGDVELGNLAIIDNISIRGPFKLVFVVFDVVMQTLNLLLKVVHFDGGLGLALGHGGEKAISDGLKDVQMKLGMGSKGCCNGIGRYRWFQALDQSDWERHRVFGG